MLIRKLFISHTAEKKWLESMNAKGYELVSAAPFSYTLEKTGKRVSYEYIPLRKGKRTFDALDYKKKDKSARAVYCKSDMALFKKPADAGAFTVADEGEKRIMFAWYRNGIWTRALVYLAVFAMLSMLASRFSAPLIYVPAAAFLLLSCVCFYKLYRLDKKAR